VMDEIFIKYGKSTYQTELIKMVRWLASKEGIPSSKKAIYNKVLIYLFTIGDL
jgi:hypothetical protein